MPTTRRSTGGTRARPGPGKGQSTISFSNKVTKNVATDVKKAVVADSPLKKVVVPEPEPEAVEAEEQVPDVAADEESEQEAEAEVQEPAKSEAELRAEKITAAQVKRYWNKIEAERISSRVHQEDLDVSEKVLRYFDVSSQYGVSLSLAAAPHVDLVCRTLLSVRER